eukprot:TRINITY_DN9176_c0_g1_i1.p1 TRINITY_DN9176_c0_g1~~TRINITY_DN9176_c0_g1_i1.p1  ORF type:complete len:512 (+),score=67.02 TRINITY_DN9176_c0_g1_i1:397-1932(+)
MPVAYLTRLNSALRSGLRKPIHGWQGPQNSVEAIIQSKGSIPHTQLFSTLTDVHLFSRSCTNFSKSNTHVDHHRRSPSIVGALSRALSVPSVSGPSCQICEYHIDRRISDSAQISVKNYLQRKFLPPYGSFLLGRAELGDLMLDKLTWKSDYLSNFTTRANLSYSNRSLDYCIRVSRCIGNRESCGSGNIVYGYFSFDVTVSSCKSSPFIGSGAKKSFHGSCSALYSAGAAPDVALDCSSREEQIDNSVASSESDPKILGDRTLKLLSGSCYLPHPDKEETGGEDAHFICVDEQAIGVADGVGGWADQGVDAGQYARELMSHSVLAIQEEPKGFVNPARVLEKAYSSTKARGSSTACIIALTSQGVHAVNLGDSGFIVVREGCTIFRSPVQQHDFNFTYQLECGNSSDLPSAAQVFTFPVESGDVIIAGTDGLFDNLYNNEVTAVVVHAVRAGFGPQVTAQKIAALARQRAQDKNRQTPFSTAAQDAGYRYYGGKLDDITVIVSYIIGSSM